MECNFLPVDLLIVEKYHRMHAAERHDSFFGLKLLIPPARHKK